MSAKSLLALGALAGLTACATDFSSTPFDEPDRPIPFQAADYAAACGPGDDWDKPAPPFRLYGETYHVGTCGISAILITSPDGHLLIDGGTEKGGELIADNIRKLGFSLRHVTTISHTQEHFDHVAGIAHLKAATGAALLASEVAAPVFETGLSAPSDPQYGLHDPFPAVSVDEVIADGHVIPLGGKEVTAHYTPGHSAGAMSWRWEECEDNDCLTIVFTDGMSPISADDYRWTDHPDYLAAFRESIAWLATVEADICLSTHPAAMVLFERIEAGNIVDPLECGAYAADISERLEGKVAVEMAEEIE